MAGIIFIRLINKHRSSDSKGGRQQMPRLRLVLNILVLTALSAIMALIGWDILSFLKFENAPAYIRFTIEFSALYIWLLSIGVTFLRFRNKGQNPRVGGEERRHRHGLRRALNFAIMAPVGVLGVVLLYNLLR
jgi:multisubunit Na+/H+ antiporter MnhB subunit